MVPWEPLDGASRCEVQLECTEFTSRCPVTKQPDFGSLNIIYTPEGHLVETKSLKLWLWQFRDRACFNEKLCREIAMEFFRQVRPRCVTVKMDFKPRGGIAVHAMYSIDFELDF